MVMKVHRQKERAALELPELVLVHTSTVSFCTRSLSTPVAVNNRRKQMQHFLKAASNMSMHTCENEIHSRM